MVIQSFYESGISALFPETETGRLPVEWAKDNIRVVLVVGYEFDASHRFLADLGECIAGRGDVVGRSISYDKELGLLSYGADSAVCQATVPGVNGAVVYVDSGDAGTSDLLVHLALPDASMIGTGDAVQIKWPQDGVIVAELYED